MRPHPLSRASRAAGSLCWRFIEMEVVPNNASPWNQQKVLETVRGLKEISRQQKTALEAMVQSQNAELASAVQRSTTLAELERSLVALAKQIVANAAAENGCAGADSPVESARRAITEAIEKFGAENKVSLVSQAGKAIQKILQKVRKKPNDPRSRRLACTNIVVKKFIIKVKGASAIMEACGYAKEDVGGKPHLVLRDVNTDVLDIAIEAIKKAVADAKSGKKPAIARQSTRVRCPCGFWGSTDQDGLCSVCFKKKTFGVPDKAADAKAAAKKKKGLWKPKLKRARIKLRALHRFRMGVKESKVIQTNKKRCFKCNKKIGILGFECRCMYIFCEVHRHPDSHCCTFDYKRHHRNKLKKDNQVVAHEKITKLD